MASNAVFRNALKAMGLLGALALAGCGGGGDLDGAFGAQDTTVAGAARSAAGVQTADGRLTVGTGPNAVEYECPPVTVRSGASAWQVPDNAGGLKQQTKLGQLARECSILGDQMNVKVGIEGRVLLGDKGQPGTVNVPVRIAVVEEGPNPRTVATKFFVVPVDVPAGDNQAAFAVVEDQVSFPLGKPESIARHVIYVGFDPKGSPASAAPAKPRRQRPATSSSSSSSSSSSPSSSSSSAKPKPAASGSSSGSSGSGSASSARPAAPPSSGSSDVFGPPPGGASAPARSAPAAAPSPDVFGPPPG